MREALRQSHREDLIGTGRNCLVPPEGVKTAAEYAQIRREKKAREERRAQRVGKPAEARKSAPRSGADKRGPRGAKTPQRHPAGATKGGKQR